MSLKTKKPPLNGSKHLLNNMLRHLLYFTFLFSPAIFKAQSKLPWLFRWQDKKAKNHIHQYLKHDTLITAASATLHLHYTSFDTSKQTVLMLHGMGLNARTNWYNQIEPFSKEFNVIMPDLIYFGESTSNSGNYAVEFQVDQLHDALEKIQAPKKLTVIGFSYGGLTAAVYNELYPDQIKKLIIIDGPVKYFSGAVADSLAKTVGVNGLGNVIVPTTPFEFDAMQQVAIAKPINIGTRLKKKVIRYIFLPQKTIRMEQINYLLKYQTRYQTYNYNLATTPTLLIWGEKDGIIPLTVGKALHDNFAKTTRLITFPNAKHDAHFSESEKVNQEMIDFIKH